MVLALGVVGFELGKHHGHAAVHELIEDRLFFAKGQTATPSTLRSSMRRAHVGKHGRVAVGGADQNLVATGDGDLFKALDQLRKEGVGDVLNDDAEEAAAAGDEGARMGVGKVVELLDRLPDAL
jgi:hypothetical protein